MLTGVYRTQQHINNINILYSTGKYIQDLVITRGEKECNNEYMYVHA